MTNLNMRQQIINNEVIDKSPSFSPDDSNLVCASNRSQGVWEPYAYFSNPVILSSNQRTNMQNLPAQKTHDA